MLSEGEVKRIGDFFYRGSLNYDRLKKEFPEINEGDLKDWYNNQEVIQLVRTGPERTKKVVASFKPVIAYYPFERLYLDTAFVKKYKLVLVVGLDLYSRYGFCKVYRGDREQGITSVKARDALKEFITKIKKLGYEMNSFSAVYTDDGSEYKGSFSKFLKDHKIDQVVAVPQKLKQVNVERFIKTLRLYIEKYKLAYGGKIGSKEMEVILDYYNNNPHSSLIAGSEKLTPTEALLDFTKSRLLYDHYVELRGSSALEGGDEEKVEIGTPVRYYIRSDAMFRKTGRNFSKSIVKVVNYDPASKTYGLEGVKRRFRVGDLMPINLELFNRYNYTLRPRTPAQEKAVDESLKPRRRERLNKDLLEVIHGPVQQGKRKKKQRQVLDL